MVQIFINPLSNNGMSLGVEKDLISYFKAKKGDTCEITICDITKIKDVGEYIKNASETDIFVVAGGDGTISYFANDVYELNLQNKIRQEIFYYACGSGNDFFNDTGCKEDVHDNLVPFNQYIESLPYVVVKGMKKYFVNGIGYGIDGYCCEEGDKIRASSNKKVNYTSIAIKGILGGFKPVNAIVEVDGEKTEYKKVWLAPSMIGRYYGGGMMIAPQQNRLNKEKTVSCVVAHDLSLPKIVSIFPKIFKGNHVKHTKYVTIKKGHRINVTFDVPTALQIDGETVTGVTSYSVVYE